MTLRFELLPVLRDRRLAIAALIVEGLDIEVEEQPEQWRVSGMSQTFGGPDEPDGEPPALRVVDIAQLEFRGAHLLLKLGEGATRLDARLDLAAQGVRWASGEATLLPASAASQIALAESVVEGRAVERADLALRLAGASLQIERADVAGAFGRIDAKGEAELASAALPPQLARARADATLTGLDLAALAGDPELASRLDGTLHAEFAPDAASSPAPASCRRSSRCARRNSVSSTSRRCACADRSTPGRGRSRSTNSSPPVRPAPCARTAREAARRSTLPKSRPISGSNTSPLPGSGTRDCADAWSSKAEARGTLEDPEGRLDLVATELRRADSAPARLEVRARLRRAQRAVRIDTLSFESPGLAIRASEPARFRVDFADAPALLIEALGLAFPGGVVRARGRVTSTALAGLRIDLEERDLAATAAALGLDAAVSGAIEGSISADGPLARPALRGNFVASPIAFQDQRFGRIEIAVAPDGPRTVVTARLLDAGAERLRVVARAANEALWSLLPRNCSSVPTPRCAPKPKRSKSAGSRDCSAASPASWAAASISTSSRAARSSGRSSPERCDSRTVAS